MLYKCEITLTPEHYYAISQAKQVGSFAWYLCYCGILATFGHPCPSTMPKITTDERDITLFEYQHTCGAIMEIALMSKNPRLYMTKQYKIYYKHDGRESDFHLDVKYDENLKDKIKNYLERNPGTHIKHVLDLQNNEWRLSHEWI